MTEFFFSPRISPTLRNSCAYKPPYTPELSMSGAISFRQPVRPRIKMLTVNMLIWSCPFNCFQYGCQSFTEMVFSY